MKFNFDTFKDVANLVKSTERYDLYDMKLDHLTLSMTRMNPKQETRGHDHEGVEEVYFCLDGDGQIQVGEEKIDFKKGDVVTIPPGDFHKVFNPSDSELVFFSIFESYDRDSANYSSK
ncbi:TPA: cupin domain-containing protein [archaeon]|nr:cupin domain-containing protein [Candidatus Undinarchaeales archaeon SRR5007147.bin71]